MDYTSRISSWMGCLALVAAVNASSFHLDRKINRIINGEVADLEDFPFMITFLIDGKHLCGGAIIANGWAITAAHCTFGQNLSSMGVVTDMSDFSNTGNYQWFDVDYFIENQHFDEQTHRNDIALLRLRLEGRDTSHNIITVADGSNSFIGEPCTIAGWGVTENDVPSNQLRFASVTALSILECQVFWGSNVNNQHLCVMGMDTQEGAGACNYDNGGPLICSEVLAGLISYGHSGCHDNGVVPYPTVCTSVGRFYSWIYDTCGGCI